MLDILKFSNAEYELMYQFEPRIMKISLPGAILRTAGLAGAEHVIAVSEPRLLAELFQKEDVFNKWKGKESKETRKMLGDGLATADTDEPIWKQAHRILSKSFSLSQIRTYFNVAKKCEDLLCEYIDKCIERKVPVDSSLTIANLTFEAIGRICLGCPMNAFTKPHPLVGTFNGLMKMQKDASEGSGLSQLGSIVKIFTKLGSLTKELNKHLDEMIESKKKFAKEREGKGTLSEEETGVPAKTMMDYMVQDADEETGQKLSEQNIRYQMLTFLTAGHITTMTVLCNALYWIASMPNVEQHLYDDILQATGGGEITFDNLGEMNYLSMFTKENLRLAGISMIAKYCKEDSSLGEFHVPANTGVLIIMRATQYDPKIYPNPTEFDPTRWTEENCAKRENYTWLPFSYGKRGCIGFHLSILEQKLTVASLVKKYHIRIDQSSSCQWVGGDLMQWSGVKLRFTPRDQPAPGTIPHHVSKKAFIANFSQDDVIAVGKQLLVLYGSNGGTSQGLGERLMTMAKSLGFSTTMAKMDSFLGATSPAVPEGDGAVVFITSTYNGFAPDNAAKFSESIDGKAEFLSKFSGVLYGVFGVGNKQWGPTYQMFPMKVDGALKEAGALPISDRGSGDMDQGHVEAEFQTWSVIFLVAAMQRLGINVPQEIREKLNPPPPIYDVFNWTDRSAKDLTLDTVQLLTPSDGQATNSSVAEFLTANGHFVGNVSENRELQAAGTGRSTRHVSVDLPEGVPYTAGDHLGVMVPNPDEVVLSYLEHLSIRPDAVVRVAMSEASRARLPLDTSLPVFTLLAYYVELQQVASREQLQVLSQYADPAEQAQLERLASFDDNDDGDYIGRVQQPRKTVLEVLQTFPSVKVDLGALLGCLPPMKPRYYSISSAPSATPKQVTVTVAVVEGQSPTGRLHKGVCSHGLSVQPRKFPASVYPDQPPMPFTCFVKDTGTAFRLPPRETPVILIGPGTGVAPMRAFIQDRAAMGKDGGETILFFGCRNEGDFIYREELEKYQNEGIINLFVAFSRKDGVPKTYVQHLLGREAETLKALLAKGAHIFVCGDASRMAPDVKKAFQEIVGDERFADLDKAGRFKLDVWASQSL